MQKTSKIIISGLLAAVFISAPVFAQASTGDDSSNGSDPAETHTSSTKDQEKHGTSSGSDSAKDRVEAETKEDHHFKGDKLKLCVKRQADIGGVMERLGGRGQAQLDLFTKIATRVETFYTKSGKTLGNYDDLVAAVNAQKTVAQASVDAVKADKANFKCDGTNPAGTAQTFKTDLQTEIQALKDYRTAVRNLIVGVKSVVSDTAKTDGGTH